MPSPMEIAHGLLGAGEVPNRAAIQDYLRTGGQNLDPVTTAWCAAFVNSSLVQAKFRGTGSMAARSFMNYGEPVAQPQRGDIAVFTRGGPTSGLGHVGFFDSINPDGTIRILAGNQGDAVAYGNMKPDELLGYRRPGAKDAVGEATASATGSAPGTGPAAGLAGMYAGAAPATPNFGTVLANLTQQKKAAGAEAAAEEQARRQALFSGPSPFV